MIHYTLEKKITIEFCDIKCVEIKIRPNLNLRTFYVTELNSELQKSQLITLYTNLLETLSPSWQLEHAPIEVE